jgi:hypothetical protein
MTPAEMPQELVDLLDERAGKRHSREGRVLTALAEILTRYDELRATGQDWSDGVRWAAAAMTLDDARAAAVEAAKNWALMYPIPAWSLAHGAGAEKLASNWAEAIGRQVIDEALAQAWLAGVRWAAAEADAQVEGREPACILDITDHLRACANGPGRSSVVARTEAPAEAAADHEAEHASGAGTQAGS